MSVRANVCGNCSNFKPKQGDKFFNCTYATQGGVKYAMQVRADTRSCEAFSPLSQPSKLPPKAQPTPPLTKKRAQPGRGGLCPWGRIIMLAAIVIIILLLAWGAYTCYSGRGTTPTPTPTPTTTLPPTTGPTPTIVRTPVPTPTPLPIFQYNLGEWVAAPPLLILASSAEKTNIFYAPGPNVPPAGTSFIIVTVSMTNGGALITTAASDFTIVSESGFSFPPIQAPAFYYNAYPFERTALFPGASTGGRIIYIVPDVVSQLRIQTSTSGGIVQWIIP